MTVSPGLGCVPPVQLAIEALGSVVQGVVVVLMVASVRSRGSRGSPGLGIGIWRFYIRDGNYGVG